MTNKTTIESYEMPGTAKTLLHLHPPLMICGITAAGKDTIARYLMQNSLYAHIVSHTTRPPRSHLDGHEVNGVDYWFIDNDEAERMARDHEFIEVKFVHGHTIYGTSIEAYEKVIALGRVPLLEIDVQGIAELMKVVDGIDAIFLLPPSFEVWQERLQGRGLMSEDEQQRRYVSAVRELETLFANPRFVPVINNEVVETTEIIENGTYRDESYRTEAMKTAQSIHHAIKLQSSTH